MKLLIFGLLFSLNLSAQSISTVPAWSYSTPVASPITNTTPVVLKAAPAGTGKVYLTGLQVYNTSATVASVVTVLKASTVIWTGYVPLTSASLQIRPIEITFPTPVETGAAQALNFVVNTTGANVFVSAQGFTGK